MSEIYIWNVTVRKIVFKKGNLKLEREKKYIKILRFSEWNMITMSNLPKSFFLSEIKLALYFLTYLKYSVGR